MPTRLQVIAGRGFALALAMAGVLLLPGGLRLLFLGGSWWYATAGVALLTSAALLWRSSRWGAWLYGCLLLVTVGWSLWEVGLDGWALLPRLGLLLLGGLWLITPLASASLRPVPPPLLGPRARLGAWVVIAALVLAPASATILRLGASPPEQQAWPDDTGTTQGWPSYGNDAGGTRHSPLSQIHPGNVARLQPAWTARTGDLPGPGMQYNFEATPLQVGRLLYLCTPGGRVLALDAADGRRAWQFQAPSGERRPGSYTCRGVAYGEGRADGKACATRIYSATPDNRLWALDALTGRPCRDFGNEGAVDLHEGLGDVPSGSYSVTSPPLVTRGRVVVGALVVDTVADIPSGVVRAYDAQDGSLAWAWDVGRPDRTGAPPAGETYTRSTPNVWAPMVADDVTGLVFLPTGNPALDFHGARRRDFDEAFGTALVAVDVVTGVTRWRFQVTHHDVWDFDLASQPTLLEMRGPSGPRLAVAVGTKSGGIFVLDRLTGEPIVPVLERPVPQAGSVETRLSATQPESALEVSPGPARLREATMWGLTPFDHMWCRIRFLESRYEGPYTPPGTDREVLVYPGLSGGIEWGGLAVDPVRRLLVTNPNSMPFRVRFTPAADAPVGRSGQPEYSVAAYPFFSPLGIPCMQPPWGSLMAIDLDSQRVLWKRAVGSAVDSGPFGIPSRLPLTIGTPQLGGSITTRSGLVFSAATLDRYLRAYDVTSGEELWKARLPAGGQATPMTYQIDGRQYVVIAAGGHAALGTPAGDYVMAWALPSP